MSKMKKVRYISHLDAEVHILNKATNIMKKELNVLSCKQWSLCLSMTKIRKSDYNKKKSIKTCDWDLDLTCLQLPVPWFYNQFVIGEWSSPHVL